MVKLPFPCCCEIADCGDYDATWQYAMADIVANAPDSYANAETNELTSPPAGYHWYYWDAADAIADWNAWSQTFTFDPSDEDGPGTSVGGTAFDRGYSKLVAATGLTLTATLYVADSVLKPASIDFVPYEFTYSNIVALVFIRERVVAGIDRRFAELAFYGDLTTDALPGSATISQLLTAGGTALPDYSGGFDVSGKTFLGFFKTRALSEPTECIKPIPSHGPANWVFSFSGWDDGFTETTSEILRVNQPFAAFENAPTADSRADFTTL